MLLTFFQGGVLLQLFFDALLQVRDRNLQQLHELDLLRREFLQQFLVKTLFERGHKESRGLSARVKLRNWYRCKFTENRRGQLR